jgi:Dolichyl-phosphate-mannose-protein mannosyltransferase
MNAIQPDNREAGGAGLRRPMRPGVSWLIVGLLIGVGLVRIVSTYHVFNHTIDEGAHLACGMQWFQHTYTYDRKHTPLARVSVALLPYLDGVRGTGNESFWVEGVLLLSSGGRYWHNLTLARIGTLPFYVWGIVVVFLWTKRVYGNVTGVIAAGIFSMLPVILGHSGLATTDIALTACFITSAYAFTRWLENPNWRTAAGLGVATGLAVSAKLSTVAFLPVTAIFVLALYLLSKRETRAGEDKNSAGWSWRKVLKAAMIFAVCGFLVIWAAYRFSHAPINQVSGAPDKIAAKIFGKSSSAARGVRFLDAKLQLPAPELLEGLRELRDINASRPRSYLLGRVKAGGWWFFYPVAIAVKTPLAVLALAVIGAIVLWAGWYHTRTGWQRVAPIAGFLAPLVIAAPSSLDIGVRHVMPVFTYLSMLAAVGVVWLWERGADAAGSKAKPGMALWAGRAAAVVLLGWSVASSAFSHPDYLAYFNELGGKHPENILVISDLDWGQDLTRLADYARENQITHLGIAYENYYDPVALGLPDVERVGCGTAPAGWVAMEVRRARVYPECYPWLSQQKLVTTVGKTELLYYLAEPYVPPAGSMALPSTETPAKDVAGPIKIQD